MTVYKYEHLIRSPQDFLLFKILKVFSYIFNAKVKVMQFNIEKLGH